MAKAQKSRSKSSVKPRKGSSERLLPNIDEQEKAEMIKSVKFMFAFSQAFADALDLAEAREKYERSIRGSGNHSNGPTVG